MRRRGKQGDHEFARIDRCFTTESLRLVIIAAIPATNAIVKQTGNNFISCAVETYAHNPGRNLTRSTRPISKLRTSRWPLSTLDFSRKVSARTKAPDVKRSKKLQ